MTADGTSTTEAPDDGRPPASPARPPGRRGVLAGGVAGLAALGGALVAAASPAGQSWTHRLLDADPALFTSPGATAAGSPTTTAAATGMPGLPSPRPPAPASASPSVVGSAAGSVPAPSSSAAAATGTAPTTPTGTPTSSPTSTPATGPAVTVPEAAPPEAATTPPATSTPIAAPADLHHLLRRATYGPTPASVAQASAVGLSAWLAAQLDHTKLADPVGARIDAAHPGLFMSIGGARTHYGDKFWVMANELVRWRVHRSVWSTRQLHEVMTDLMHNHLNVPIGPDGPTGYAIHRYHHDVVRAHALGSFASMLVASAEHPAMLHYLNANTSTKKAPNENYARELLELHTVGVGTHTEADVLAAAKLFTGWRTWWPWENGGEAYTAWFDPAQHHIGPVTVLGRTYPNAAADGRAQIRTFLNDLARHPATAAHVCHKLAVHLVDDNPTTSLVDSLAQVYLANDTRLGPVLQSLFASRAFAEARGTKVRRPLERYLATIRLVAPAPTSDANLSHDALVWRLPAHRPLSWAAPDGYPDVAAEWGSAGAALTGVNGASELVRGWSPVAGKQLTDAVLATPARDIDSITDELSRRILLRPAQSTELDSARHLLSRSTVRAGPWSETSYDRYRAVWYVAVLLLSHPLLLDR